jgi:thiol:disulfide interchange protein DsbA
MENTMLKRLLISSLLLLALPFAACAQDEEGYKEGEHYQLVVPAIRTANPDKIEVMEFFWYGCIHCYNLEPMLEAWKKTLGDDVEVRGSPASWNAGMELHARAFYASQVLGVEETMHPVLFQAMNVDRKRLSSEAEIAELYAAHGVATEDFSKVFNSFGVGSQAGQATARARAAKITGTPELLVNGKFRISARSAGGQAEMLKVAAYLIEKERAAGN